MYILVVVYIRNMLLNPIFVDSGSSVNAMMYESLLRTVSTYIDLCVGSIPVHQVTTTNGRARDKKVHQDGHTRIYYRIPHILS